MYEPRGHAAMSGAILQPPTRPDADYGVLFIEVSGCLPMCGHGTIGVATVLVETGMVPVTEPVTTIRLDTPAGLVVAEVAVEDGAATAVTLRNVPSFAVGLDRKVEVPGYGEVALRPRVRRQLLRDRRARRARAAVRPRRARTTCSTPGWRSWTPINAAGPARPPGGPGHPRLPPRLPRRARLGRPRTPGTRWRSTRAGSTARPAAPAPAPGWPSCTPAASCRCDTRLRQRVVHRHPLHRPARRARPTVGGLPAVVPTITGRAWITGTAQYLLDPDDPFPGRLPALTSSRLPQSGGPLATSSLEAPAAGAFAAAEAVRADPRRPARLAAGRRGRPVRRAHGGRRRRSRPPPTSSAALAVREVGKPLTEARAEVARTAAIRRYYAQPPYDPVGAVHEPAAGPGLLLTRRRPHGVAGLITPWNFPFAIPIWKAAPALAVGNAVVLKPAPEATACALRLAELIQQRLPDGRVHRAARRGDRGQRAVVAAADVVSFTGSTAVGRAVVRAATARGIPVQAEMGGQNAAIVLPDADIDAAAGPASPPRSPDTPGRSAPPPAG